MRAEAAALRRRVRMFHGRLYLEAGGKLYNDNHAARVLPGYDPDTKVRLLRRFGDRLQLVQCISAPMIDQGKRRGETRVLYSDQLVRDVRELRRRGMETEAVFISRISPGTRRVADAMARRIAREFGRSIRVLRGYEIPGYPRDLKAVLGGQGYGRHDYLRCRTGITAVTAPGPGSGKMAFCMAQMYDDRKRGVRSGYAKIETFPVWNLPLVHPVNVAYEAATADIGDYNVLDRRHKAAYGVTAVNYNRDAENFAVMKRIIDAMTDKRDPLRRYRSPTDMGIGRTRAGITDDRAVREAAEVEVLRRYWQARHDYAAGLADAATMRRMERVLDRI
jgi:uncharacterized protein (UPF0371 family)